MRPFQAEFALRLSCSLLLSVRSTNVYEEKSLGVFEDEDDDIDDDADYLVAESRVTIWGRYLGRHVRKQLSFGQLKSSQIILFIPPSLLCTFVTLDMWWLAFALFLVCIIEVR